MNEPRIEVPILNAENAPESSRGVLKAVQGRFGFVPNMLGAFANAPALLEGYLALAGIFDKTSLSPTERQVVLLAVSVENGCEYCVAAHTVIARMQKVEPGVLRALRENTPIDDTKLEALRALAADTVRTRGWPAAETVSRFRSAGYTDNQALEVIVGIGVKTISNYVNHLVQTPLDQAFLSAAWTKPERDAKGDGAR